MSEIKVNKLTPRTNCGTVTLGDSGDTFTIPAGATISNLGTATGFGATGAVNWDVSSIKTTDFTAVSGNGYFVDTATTGAVEVTLPAAPSVGDVVGVSDYANNFGTANCTLNRNSLKIGGNALNSTLSTDGVAVTLVYVDVTKGWIVTDSGNQSDAPGPLFITATGGCITTCGNYKIHTFLSPATFTVCSVGNPAGSDTVDYLVVAGGGGGGGYGAGGGGAGGFRLSNSTCMPAPLTSPLAAPTGEPVSAIPGAYPITIGGGGTAGSGTTSPTNATNGDDSVFSTITSTGGGGGRSGIEAGAPGGSGGAGKGGPTPTSGYCGGAGNTPPVSPPQGNPGGKGYDALTNSTQGGGGGGAGAAGCNAACSTGAAGGIGSFVLQTGFAGCRGTTGPTPSTRYFAGGGAGSTDNDPGGTGAAGGAGGGGAAGPYSGPVGVAGGVNTGGAGGAGGTTPPSSHVGGNGGSGIVIIRYKYQ